MDRVEFTNRTLSLLRKAAAHFVREESLLGTYCDFDQICIPISKLMCGWEGQEDMKQIDHKMLVDALSTQGGVKEYIVPFWQMVGGTETDPDCKGYFIHVTNGERKVVEGKIQRVYKIGCVMGEGAEPETVPGKNNHPLKDGLRLRDFKLSKDELWVGMRDQLTKFLRERKGTAAQLKKDNAKKAQKSKLEKAKEDNAKRSRPGTAKSADSAKSKESGSSPSKKKGKRRKRPQHTELKAEIEKMRVAMTKLVHELLEKLKEDNMENYTEDHLRADEDAPQMSASVQQQRQPPQTLSYILNGRAGKFTKDLSVLTLKDLEDGLLPLEENENDIAARTREKTQLKQQKYGATTVWVPAAATAIGKHVLTTMQQQIEIVKKLQGLFSSEQSSFSQQALRIMTMFGLHNMGGSDEGMEMLIAGVLKALFHDIGFELDSKSAGHVRKTNVGEERGSHRGTTHSYIIRRFNQRGVLQLRSEKDNEEEKKKIKRIWGRKRIIYFANFVDEFAGIVEAATAAMDRDKYKALCEYIGSEESRQSSKETRQLINKVRGGVDKVRKVTKSEMAGGVEVTADMDGGIYFSILTKKNGFESHVDAEIRKRGIESRLTSSLEETPIGEKLKLLKQQAKLDAAAAGRTGDPNFIIPQSEEMKSLYGRQREIMAEKRAKKS